MMNYRESKSVPLHPEIGRRRFLKTSLAGGTTALCLPFTLNIPFHIRDKLKYALSLDVPTRFFDGKSCWAHPRAGIVPGAGNEGLPLFMAQVDSKRLHAIRETEQVLVPERGARLGNFGVTDVSSLETWVTVAEWMQPRGVEKYGSDGSVFISRIHWAKPNRLFSD